MNGSKSGSKNGLKITYCAGGIVWRESSRGREVLLILSRKNQDWKFPKGHIDDDDDGWDAAAQREVKEETGYDTVITDFAGFTKYPVNNKTKVVLYWHMTPVGKWSFEPSGEIEKCEWTTLREAFNRLTFQDDKEFLRQFVNEDEL